MTEGIKLKLSEHVEKGVGKWFEALFSKTYGNLQKFLHKTPGFISDSA
jgi:hypothetical protein